MAETSLPVVSIDIPSGGFPVLTVPKISYRSLNLYFISRQTQTEHKVLSFNGVATIVLLPYALVGFEPRLSVTKTQWMPVRHAT
jgi:hypothetical protein